MKRYWTTQDQVDNQSVPGIYDERHPRSRRSRNSFRRV